MLLEVRGDYTSKGISTETPIATPNIFSNQDFSPETSKTTLRIFSNVESILETDTCSFKKIFPAKFSALTSTAIPKTLVLRRLKPLQQNVFNRDFSPETSEKRMIFIPKWR